MSRAFVRSVSSLCLVVALPGCLGTIVEAPTGEGESYGSTRAHLIGASTTYDASRCRSGLQQVATFVPLWGVAVGILTFGILVPMTTVYTCAK
jgi:hypothetical protein